MSPKALAFLALGGSAALALTSCGSGGSGTPGTSGTDDGLFSDVAGEEVPEAISPFPPARPPVDPASSVDEIERLARSVLDGYDELMVEVFAQVNELYRSIESGVNSSTDPDALERDARLYDAIAGRGCSGERDAGGEIVALGSCYPVPLAFRHPVYTDVLVYIKGYDLSIGSRGFSEIEIASDAGGFPLPRSLRLCTDDAFCNISSADEGELSTRLDVTLDVPDGFIGEQDRCLVQFSPFEFGTGLGDTNVNECAAVLADAQTVLQRLNDR